jgi:hypothetical protein
MLLFLGDEGVSRLAHWLSNEPDVDVRRTRRLLAPSGIVCPDLDAKGMAVYLSRLVASGHLPHAASGREPT